MHIDELAPKLSFFFSNGMAPEYSVIGRVARRIWAVAMKNRCGANERSRELKYRIQSSGRSLDAQEIDCDDIGTALQAPLAIHDNCKRARSAALAAAANGIGAVLAITAYGEKSESDVEYSW